MQRVTLSVESSGVVLAGIQVRSVRGREAVSELFRFAVELVSDAEVPLPAAIATNGELTLVLEIGTTFTRRIHGMIARIERDLGGATTCAVTRLELVPRVHRATLVESPSVYVGATLAEVLAAKLDGYQFSGASGQDAGDYELQLIDTLPRRDLTVQYGESDLAFLLRLCEHLGVSFFFEQTIDRDRIVFTDHNGCFRRCEGASDAHFDGTGSAQGVFALLEEQTVIPNYFQERDQNPTLAASELEGDRYLGDDVGAGGVIEFGANPGTAAEATRLAQVRAEERRCRQVSYRGKSTLAGFTAGGRTILRDHPQLGTPASGFELLLVEVVHEVVVPTTWDTTTAPTYRNEFVAVPFANRFRPERKTTRLRMPSVVTGVIQPGPNGEVDGVAQLDEAGRYQVFFHFDIESPFRPRSSSPIRMAQPFAGSSHGMHFPLRRGTEVLVAFINGDPDRPVIVGALPNATAPAAVRQKDAQYHRIRSPHGTVIEFAATGGSAPPRHLPTGATTPTTTPNQGS